MSRQRLEEHRRIWADKPVLADIYAVWFDALLHEVPVAGRVLEVGAGPGFLSAYARKKRPDVRWVATDLVETPWNDVVADGLQLPFREATFDVVVGLDLIHHLARPFAFFHEAARVLAPGGRVAAVEPWVTALSYPVYRWLHQEGCTPSIDPRAPFAHREHKDAFDGDAAIPWRLARDTSSNEWAQAGFSPPSLVPLNGFAYLLSLGFHEASLLPRRLGHRLMKIDQAWASLAPWLGLRAVLVWNRFTAR